MNWKKSALGRLFQKLKFLLSGPAGPLLFLGPNMPHAIQLPAEPWFAYLMVVLFTALGTLSRIYFNRTTNKQTDIDATVGQIVFSIFAAALFFMVAVRMGWLVYGLSVGCGLAAWLGVEMITYLGKRLLEKLEGNKDDKKRD